MEGSVQVYQVDTLAYENDEHRLEATGHAGYDQAMFSIQKPIYDRCPCNECPQRKGCYIQCLPFVEYVNTGR